MNVFGIGTGELLLILVIVLLVMGPERIPHLARQWGRFVRIVNRFTRTWQEVSAEINRQINLEDMGGTPPKPKPSSPPAPEPEETSNIIAPPEKQQSTDTQRAIATDGPPTPTDQSGQSVTSDNTPLPEPSHE